jgi:hypothetical protein
VLEGDCRGEHLKAILPLDPLKIKELGVNVCSLLCDSEDVGIQEFLTGLHQSKQLLLLDEVELDPRPVASLNHEKLLESILLP